MADMRPGKLREVCAKELYLQTLEVYREEVNSDMPQEHRGWVQEIIRWVTCAYFDHATDSDLCNDVFRRAALIGVFWARNAPHGITFGPHALSICIWRFLQIEGASPCPQVGNAGARKAIRSAINKFRADPPATLFKELWKVCALNWVCDCDNHVTTFKGKLCHC